MKSIKKVGLSRREFCKRASGGILASLFGRFPLSGRGLEKSLNDLYWIKGIPDDPFYAEGQNNRHIGIDTLLSLMGSKGLKFYQSSVKTTLSGPSGLIAPEDIVLIKVNAQWKYRGCTNSDLIRGLIQSILDHPDIFTGEVVIIENGQGRGSLNCDSGAGSRNLYPDTKVHANANNEKHSFLYLVDHLFNDPRVSAYLLDPVRGTFVGEENHQTDGYRIFQNVSYPCFTTASGNRVELREGIWNGREYSPNLKLINVPVLKHHDTGGSEITASLKHFYGVLSMADGQSGYRHYSGLGDTCGRMVVTVRTPVLNIVDAIWVSHSSLKGYPADTTTRVNQLLASQDPVALDYWAAKYILYPIDDNIRHHPDFPGIDRWLEAAEYIINLRGGLHEHENLVKVSKVTKDEQEMKVYSRKPKGFVIKGHVKDADDGYKGLGGVVMKGLPGNPVTDESGKFKDTVHIGWEGSITPDKAGYVFEPSSRDYSEITSDLLDQDFVGVRSVAEPLNFLGTKMSNRSLFQYEYFNILTWQANPQNSEIVKYHLYEKSGNGSKLLVELDAGVFEHLIRNVDKEKKYVYALTAIDVHGRESTPSVTSVK
jgi:hypothetical protein